MEIEIVDHLQGTKRKCWEALLSLCQLEADFSVTRTVLIWENNRLIGTGSRRDNVLKCICVNANRQGEGLMATLLTHLRQDAFSEGFRHLFLYTKPSNRWLFQSLFFYPVIQTDQVLLMENQRNGLQTFLDALPVMHTGGKIGACVMNCNPFTLGHLHLIEQAAGECDWVYVFVLSEDVSRFTAEDRFQMVKLGTKSLANVTVYPTGPYLISAATFPSYFIKDRDRVDGAYCQLDIKVFVECFAPKFSITHRYVGTEPLSPMTAFYNQALQQGLPAYGITVREIPRLETKQIPISATNVRQLIDNGETQALTALLPQSTVDYLKEHRLL